MYRLYFDNDTYLDMKPADTELGKLWNWLMGFDSPISPYQTDRIYGLNDEWTIEGIFKTLEFQHNLFEMYDHTLIEHEFDFDNIDFNDKPALQDMLNKLHEIFVAIMDVRRDGVNQGLVAERKHPQEIIDTSQLFNILIHRCEGLMWNSKQITVSFTDRPRHKLIPEHKQLFTNFVEAGDVVFKYMGTGKKLWEAFSDNDVDAITNGHIVPPFDVGPDFIVKFKSNHDPKREKEFYDWLDTHREKLLAAGIDTKSPDVTVNHFGVVGHLVDPPEEVEKFIYGAKNIVSVKKIG